MRTRFAYYHVEISGVTWDYCKAGRGEPLVLIPAFHSTIERFAPLINYLRKRYTVYVPQLPGIGTHRPLSNERHTAAAYARHLVEFITKLKLKGVILCGFSFSSVIIIRMLAYASIRPKSVILCASFSDGAAIRLEPVARVLVRFIRWLYRKSPSCAYRLAERLLGNRMFLSGLFFVWYGLKGARNLRSIISHQIALTIAMHPHAWVECIDDIFSTALSSQTWRFRVPALLVFPKHDNIIDTTATRRTLTRLFPTHRVITVQFTKHAPWEPMDKQFVRTLLDPVLSSLH